MTGDQVTEDIEYINRLWKKEEELFHELIKVTHNGSTQEEWDTRYLIWRTALRATSDAILAWDRINKHRSWAKDRKVN